MSVRPVDPNQRKTAPLRAAEWVAQQRPVTWFLVNLGPKIDPRLMKLSRGRIRLSGTGPTVLVNHTGRKSGQQRTTPLAYFTDGDKVVVIASKGGAPAHPAWYLNMKADPEVEATTDGTFEPYTAREAEGEERKRLWDLAVTMYSGYADYQRRVPERKIPVVVLEPR